MMGARGSNLRIRAAAEFAAHHERDDAREIALIGQHLQIEHQPGVLLERRRHARWLIEGGQLARALLLGPLNTSLDVPNGVEILGELGSILRADRPRETRDLAADGIEEAAVLL